MNSLLVFLMTPIMSLEILLAEFLVAKDFIKRDNFYLRLVSSWFVCIFLTIYIELMYFILTETPFEYGTSVTSSGMIFKVFYYLSIFTMTIFSTIFCYKQSFTLALVCCSVGYAIQYLTSNIGTLLKLFNEYIPKSFSTFYEIIVLIVSCLIVYIPMYFILKNRRFEEASYTNSKKGKVFLCFLVVIIFIVLSRFANDDPNKSMFASIVEPIYGILCSGFIIVIEFYMSKNDSMHNEIWHIKELLHLERKQYSLNKDSIEIINEKCHDLKHQIGMLRVDGSEKQISEIENAIMIYDSTIKTGSDVLDILLTEKKLLCKSKKIQFTPVVNGQLIKFMSDMDIYSLFGNALSNAIESVSQIKEEKMRHISLKVKSLKDMCSIHIENYYQGEIFFEGDFPTTHKDERYHGYGMKSMRRIIESYGGIMTITTNNNIFSLDFLISLA